MKMNENSIRIREINAKDLEWSDYVDLEKQDLVVPCFYSSGKYKYTGFLKPSLDLLHFRKQCETRRKADGEKVIFRRNEVEYTDAFILVNMNESHKCVADKASEEAKGFEYIYLHGIYELEDAGRYTKYVEYKRSGNAAKKGKHIFVREDFYEDMMKWTWLGCSPKSLKVSLPYVEMKAYEALVNSNIKGTVTIHPDEILLLDDKDNTFRSRVAMVREEDGEFSIQRYEGDVTNKVFDGECLLDKSVFEAAGMDAGMILLRNFFFKSCGFRTDIQGYYKEVFGAEYKSAKVEDVFGKQIEIKKVKMIVTTSSFKMFKFRNFFAAAEQNSIFPKGTVDVDNTQMEKLDSFYDGTLQEMETYALWRRKVEENGGVFGVVKNEEAHREKRKFTYQMINSMHFSESDIHELMAEDIQKFVELRTNNDFYEAYIAGGKEREGGDDPSYTEHFIVDLAGKNPMFRQTDIYKEKRSNDLRAFKQKLYEGKLSIDADYYTLCSMPWELLQYSLNHNSRTVYELPDWLKPAKNEEAFQNPILQKGEIYIAGLSEGEQLTLCRNPHACASNVVYATNRVVPELEKWFLFKRKNGFSNIIVISPWEWDVMEALNGADFDSDEVLGIRNEIVLERAKELAENEMISAIPHADISADKRGVVEMGDFEQHYMIEDSLSGNKIGLISNYTQILNAYYWDSFREDSRYAESREELYDDIQMLAVLMGLEIDKAKHAYSFEAEKVAKNILDKYSVRDANNRKRRNRPIFMCYIDENRHDEAARKAAADLWLDCPMDYVAKKLYNIYSTEEALRNLKQTPTIDIEDVFEVGDYKGCDAHKVETVLEKMDDCVRNMKPLNMNKADLDWAENAALKKSLLEDTYRLMEKNKISLKEMKRILYLLFEKEPADKMKKRKAAKAFYECLLVNNQETIAEILGKEDVQDFSQGSVNKASTEYIEQAKKSGEKKQINYAKCNKLFAEFLEINRSDEAARNTYASKIKRDKNVLNIAYMLQTISTKRSYAAAKNDKLISLAMLYHVWPELFLKCV